MAKDKYYGKTLRKNFARHEEIMPMPNLLEIQKDSYQWFLDTGLQAVFADVGVISDYADTLELSFIDYSMDEPPKYDVEECKARDATYAAPLKVKVRLRNKETGEMERKTMYCAIVVPYRVRVVIPDTEMWEQEQARPDFVLQNMVGATIDFIIIKVDRENGVAVASRRLAARSQRYFFAHRPNLSQTGVQVKCRVLSVGPRRCLVECYGHDINLTQRDLRYTAIPDLRNAYHPGEELDCIVKSYDAGNAALRISVKETESNPFEGAELRHPVGSRRQAAIAGKYGGGVFCNLPDGTVCMCSYSYQHKDADFMVGDTVILVVQRYDSEKRQMYGKILSKW